MLINLTSIVCIKSRLIMMMIGTKNIFIDLTTYVDSDVYNLFTQITDGRITLRDIYGY